MQRASSLTPTLTNIELSWFSKQEHILKGSQKSWEWCMWKNDTCSSLAASALFFRKDIVTVRLQITYTHKSTFKLSTAKCWAAIILPLLTNISKSHREKLTSDLKTMRIGACTDTFRNLDVNMGWQSAELTVLALVIGICDIVVIVSQGDFVVIVLLRESCWESLCSVFHAWALRIGLHSSSMYWNFLLLYNKVQYWIQCQCNWVNGALNFIAELTHNSSRGKTCSIQAIIYTKWWPQSNFRRQWSSHKSQSAQMEPCNNLDSDFLMSGKKSFKNIGRLTVARVHQISRFPKSHFHWKTFFAEKWHGLYFTGLQLSWQVLTWLCRCDWSISCYIFIEAKFQLIVGFSSNMRQLTWGLAHLTKRWIVMSWPRREGRMLRKNRKATPDWSRMIVWLNCIFHLLSTHDKVILTKCALHLWCMCSRKFYKLKPLL